MALGRVELALRQRLFGSLERRVERCGLLLVRRALTAPGLLGPLGSGRLTGINPGPAPGREASLERFAKVGIVERGTGPPAQFQSGQFVRRLGRGDGIREGFGRNHCGRIVGRVGQGLEASDAFVDKLGRAQGPLQPVGRARRGFRARAGVECVARCFARVGELRTVASANGRVDGDALQRGECIAGPGGPAFGPQLSVAALAAQRRQDFRGRSKVVALRRLEPGRIERLPGAIQLGEAVERDERVAGERACAVQQDSCLCACVALRRHRRVALLCRPGEPAIAIAEGALDRPQHRLARDRVDRGLPHSDGRLGAGELEQRRVVAMRLA
ncbi:MAG: hypothetical protein ABI699_02620 [Caldimonas sp.]